MHIGVIQYISNKQTEKTHSRGGIIIRVLFTHVILRMYGEDSNTARSKSVGKRARKCGH